MEIGVWADTPSVHGYVKQRVLEILQGTAAAWGVGIDIHHVGECPPALQDPHLAAIAHEAARQVPGVTTIQDNLQSRAADDANVFLERVSERGGKGIYLIIGSELKDGHHTPRFDFDETSLVIGTTLLSLISAIPLSSLPQA
jgi:aminobenzoyl-glutamate utilization protein A